MACRSLLPLQDTVRRKLWLCDYCENLFIPLEKPGCNICSIPVSSGVEVCSSCYGKTFAFARNTSCFAYEGLVRDMLRDIKFRQRKYVAQGLGRLWATYIKNTLPSNAILVPLPMHTKKRRQRGFDQAQVMAQALSELTGNKLANILERTKNTPPQSGLHPQQRIENIRGAFVIKQKNQHSISEQSIILVDDIYTTGASLNECAKVLMAGGAMQVSTLTLAIALKEKQLDDADNFD